MGMDRHIRQAHDEIMNGIAEEYYPDDVEASDGLGRAKGIAVVVLFRGVKTEAQAVRIEMA